MWEKHLYITKNGATRGHMSTIAISPKANYCEAAVTYLQFPISGLLSMQRPRPASHAHFTHRQPCEINSSLD